MPSVSFFVDILGKLFIFLLLGLFASIINEVISSLLNLRGRMLLLGMEMLLDDHGNGLVEKVYDHGQISSLYLGSFNPRNPHNLPSYIPSRNFAMALLDVISIAPEDLGRRSHEVPVPMAAEPSAVPRLASLWLAAQILANNEGTKRVGVPLRSMIEAASDVDGLIKDVQRWYNSVMDTVSGWYRSKTQFMLLTIGLLLAIWLNADAIKIVNQISEYQVLHDAIVAVTQSEIGKDNSARSKSDSAMPSGSSSQRLPETSDLSQQLRLKELELLRLASSPTLGWQRGDVGGQRDDVGNLGNVWVAWLLTAVGWLLTAIVVSLAASFLFDTLNKAMVVRATIKPWEGI